MSQYLHSSYLELESLPLGDLMSLIKDVVAEQKKQLEVINQGSSNHGY
jgi:hypothetical protein